MPSSQRNTITNVVGDELPKDDSEFTEDTQADIEENITQIDETENMTSIEDNNRHDNSKGDGRKDDGMRDNKKKEKINTL